MSIRSHYYKRIFSAYLAGGSSQLTFWHDHPSVSACASVSELGEYYMPFVAKATYPHLDACGIPKLDYRGAIGWQYNPIAVAQYGLGHHTLFRRTGDAQHRDRFLIAAGWLVRNLEKNNAGLRVWNHYFDWDYRTRLQAPWYSGLAQGQGVSLLVRAFHEARDEYYLNAAVQAVKALHAPIEAGGVLSSKGGRLWIEEYIVDPPTHILNGCLWASWGLYDFWLATGDRATLRLFQEVAESAAGRLGEFDTGFWSLYEHSSTRMRMLASPFYHRLHIVQLKLMRRLIGVPLFETYAQRWAGYQRNPLKRGYALAHKCAFKLLYY